MNLFDAPIDTFNYMVLGYAVILGCIGLYIVSLALRFRHLRRELEIYEAIEAEEDNENWP
jgi:hypothetical protein